MEPTQVNNNITQNNSVAYSSSTASKIASRFPIKKILLIVIAVVLFISIVGIAISAAIDYFGFNKPKEIKLTYWGSFENESVMQALIDEYKKTHPTINIVYESQDIKGLGQYVDRLKTRIDKGTGPDIYKFHSSWVLQLKRYLTVFPQNVVESTQINSDYYKTVQRDLTLNGGYYGVPLGVDTLALYTNTRFLENIDKRPPEDWIDITRAYVPFLSLKEDNKVVISGIALGTFDNIDYAPDIIAMLMLQNGVDLNKISGENISKTIEVLDFYSSFANGSNSTWNKTLENSRTAFAKGSLAMYLGYSSDIAEIKRINPNLQFGIVHAPYLIGVKSPVASYWAEGVSSKTKYKKEAFEFLEYLSKPDTLKKLNAEREKVGETKLPYPRKSMVKLLENDILLPFAEQAEDARTTFFSANTYDGDKGMITRLNNVLGNEVRNLGESNSSGNAAKALGQGVDQILAEYAR